MTTPPDTIQPEGDGSVENTEPATIQTEGDGADDEDTGAGADQRWTFENTIEAVHICQGPQLRDVTARRAFFTGWRGG